MFQVRISAALFMAAILVGCGSPEEQFQAKVQECKKSIEAKEKVKIFFVEKEKYWVKNERFSVMTDYDVRKTDSLVTPLVGRMDVSEFWGFVKGDSREAVENLPVVASIDGRTRAVRLNFLHKNGVWVFKGGAIGYDNAKEPKLFSNMADTVELPVNVFREDEKLSKCFF